MLDKIIMRTGTEKAAPVKIRTVYYFQAKIVKITRGTNLFEAAPNAVRNLQTNRYGATLVEVLDAETDELFYSQRRHMDGTLAKPHYEWDPEATNTKFGIYVILKKD